MYLIKETVGQQESSITIRSRKFDLQVVYSIDNVPYSNK